MQQIDDRRLRDEARDAGLLAQIVRAFEVLAERQYAAPWAAARRCPDAC